SSIKVSRFISLSDHRPRPGFLQLKGKFEEFPFTAEGGTKLDPQGKAVIAESQRKRYGRGAADILQRSKSNIIPDPFKSFIKGNLRSQITNFWNGVGQRRIDQYIAGAEDIIIQGGKSA